MTPVFLFACGAMLFALSFIQVRRWLEIDLPAVYVDPVDDGTDLFMRFVDVMVGIVGILLMTLSFA